ncbi:MAG: alkaline phosphatase [Peptococcaceae bacterium]
MFNATKLTKGVVVALIFAVFFGINSLAGVNYAGPQGAEAAAGNAPKYVFYFIGDGLGATQRTVAEYYMQEKNNDPTGKLIMNTFPTFGINTTYSADTLVTDSAAAGTALAAGYKTNNGMIAQLPNGTNVKTLVELAEERGMATGLATTTRLTHATPAAFAAHNPDRDAENDIAADYVDSGVDYLVGGGYRHFVPKDGALSSKRTDDRNLVNEFDAEGYQTFISESATDFFKNYVPKAGDKVLGLFSNSHIPYEIDRVNENLNVPSIAEMTKKGIDLLSKDQDGFFFMVEGGRIDHACHANDIAGTVHDTLAFDAAIKEAVEFYNNHPDETLIVVVGDHETGGMGLGFGTNYFLNLETVFDDKISVEDILQSAYKGNRAAFYAYIAENYGLNDLTAVEKAEIEKAMDIVDKSDSAAAALYGGYDPVAIAVTHIVSERANIFWTTYAHSGTAIPMSALGVAAEKFAGYKDNTEIAKTMAAVMGFQLGLL